ncbi:uncharacterized protein fam185a isoform X1 [Hypanus sabinus]|uniref:uncharacterized protein fam185a isoform X1 n=1 Tax=Hypanus sabinus TaxID=79690 RepID=UPI0028C40FFE|nr:uncharacterized protein fam185a isoform X1 [Hypanus sabinus]
MTFLVVFCRRACRAVLLKEGTCVISRGFLRTVPRRPLCQNRSLGSRQKGNALKRWTMLVDPFSSLKVRLPCDVSVKALDPHGYPAADRAFVELLSPNQAENLDDVLVQYDKARKQMLVVSENISSDARIDLITPVKIDLDISTFQKGCVKIKKMECDNCYVETEKGHSILNSLKAHKVKVQSRGGNIICLGTIHGNVDIQTNSKGFVEIEKLQGTDMNISTTDGALKTKYIYAKSSHLSSSIGNIELGNIHDKVFSIWKRKGIKCFRDLFFEGSLMSFDQLSNKFELPKSNFFRYLQIRNFLHKILPSFPNSTSTDLLGMIFTLNPYQKGLVTFIYNMIMKIQPEISGRIKQEWEKELQYNISIEKWEKILQMVNSSSICAKHALIQFKIVHRAHMSKDKLARFYSHINPQCDRCHSDVASLTHMFWSCPTLHNYWKDIFATISSIWNIDLQPHFITAISGIPNEDDNHFSPSIRRMIAFVTLMARRSILQNWKEVNPPTTFQWFSQTISFLSLEKIRSTIFDSSIKFEETWGPFIRHFHMN